MRYLITLVTVAGAASLIVASIPSPKTYAAGAHGKGAGFAKQIFRENEKKQKAAKGKKKQTERP